MLNQPTVEKLRKLRLPGMLEDFPAQLQAPDYASLSFEECFRLLVDQKWMYREDRCLARLLRAAKLRWAPCQPKPIEREI